MEKTLAELLSERTKRIEDAIQFKIPDRVPIVANFGFFTARYTGITLKEAFYNNDAWKAACRKTVLDFEPDMYNLVGFPPGRALDNLDFRQMKWPGHGVPVDNPFQFVEGEYMKADEFASFLNDPSDFTIRTYLPRVYGSLEPFQKLPLLSSMLLGHTQPNVTGVLALPEIASALESLVKAAREVSQWQAGMAVLDRELSELGFSSFAGAVTDAPFDVVSDYLRGMRGTMLDMYRQPDRLVEACEKILPMVIEKGVLAAKRSGNPRVFMFLHRGADGFMSPKQFETFYWPTLKGLMLALIEEGLTPCPFFEGNCTSRLEYLNELPKGKVVAHFQDTDIFKAKEIIGGTVCIRGNVPISLLQFGNPQEVKEYCKKLIDVVGKDGGFIISASAPMDDAKSENVKAMIEFTKKYGRYN